MANSEHSFNIFLENVKRLRDQYALSKKKMAGIMDVSIYTINKIERGELPPKMSVTVVFNLEKYFGIAASELVSVLV